jgi:hypothetical protein
VARAHGRLRAAAHISVAALVEVFGKKIKPS